MQTLYYYDLDPLASDLWVVAGPAGWHVADIDPDALPDGFRWVTGSEWEDHCRSRNLRAVKHYCRCRQCNFPYQQ